MVEEAYTGEDLFFNLFGATGLEGRDRDYAGAGGDVLQIAYSAYTYDPQGNLVQPVTLYPGRAVASMVRVDTSSSYDAFGWNSTFPAEGQFDPYSPVGFGGQHGYYRDWTGLYLLGHRYYDAGAGRFVTRDPIGYKGGINLYGFAGNNPVNESDPSGFDPDDDQSQQLSLGARMRAFGSAPQFRSGSKERRDYSGFLSQLPGIGTAMAAHQAITGHDVVGGTRLTSGQRMLAMGIALLAVIHIRGGGAAQEINWNWNSRPTWGHTFLTHGAGSQITKNLIGRAAGTGQSMGQWLDNEATASLLSKFHGPKGGSLDISIPEGFGQLIHPDGTITSATRARIVFNANTGLFKTAFPTP